MTSSAHGPLSKNLGHNRVKSIDLLHRGQSKDCLMPKFCANLTLLYNEHPFLDRFAAAARAGFKGVEYLFPYEYDRNQLAELLARHSLVQVLHNLPAGNWAAGERGIGCHPDRVGEFQEGVGKAIEYARALGCKQLNC